MEIKAPKQSDHEAQQVQQSMINDEPTILELSNGKKVKIGWLMPVTNDKIDSIIVEHDETAKLINDGKISKAVANKKTRQHFAKITAAILLNDQIKLALFWWIKWRIIYYRWRITGEDHKNIIAEAKKKKKSGVAILSGYGILDDYGRYLDDDDEKRSRSIPSRTKLGKRAAAIEKFPYLGQPLVLFGGLITVPFWAYNHTPSAMIEVMMADLPRVEYIDPDKVTKEDIEEATRKSKAAQQRVKAHGLGANLGNRLNTNAFLRGKLGGAK